MTLPFLRRPASLPERLASLSVDGTSGTRHWARGQPTK
jgi:hypothetical protein